MLWTYWLSIVLSDWLNKTNDELVHSSESKLKNFRTLLILFNTFWDWFLEFCFWLVASLIFISWIWSLLFTLYILFLFFKFPPAIKYQSNKDKGNNQKIYEIIFFFFISKLQKTKLIVFIKLLFGLVVAWSQKYRHRGSSQLTSNGHQI